jgi:hypothetical protein
MPEPDESGTAPEAARPELPESALDDMWNALGGTVDLRLALSTLEASVPRHWTTDDTGRALKALWDKLEQEELSQIRSWGPREYLLIKPLRADAAPALAVEAAEHVRALDDLGLIARIIP